MLACAVEAAWTRLPRERRAAGLAAGMVAVWLLAWGCTIRQRVWSDSLALWLDTAARNPGSYSAANGLANAFWEAGAYTESERAARHALRLCGGSRGDAWVTLALALDGQGRVADADAAVATALEKDARLADPDARVAALAMEQAEAEGLRTLLARRSPAATGKARETQETP